VREVKHQWGDFSVSQEDSSRRAAHLYHRQTDVVFGERLRGGARAGDVVEVGELTPVVEGMVVGEAVEKLSHPPGEALNFPDAAKANRGISGEQIEAAARVERTQGFRQDANVDSILWRR